jgi:lipopolysaccharide biosynthesis glycosyltransferase
VAAVADSAYLPHFATLARSLLDRQRTSVRIHLLAESDVDPAAIERLSGWVDDLGGGIDVHHVSPSDLPDVPVNFSQTPWYRWLLPDLLADLDRVLYLDCDTLVTDSVDWLWRLDLRGHCLAAVTNLPMTVDWMERRCAALGLPSVDDYFNAGVLLMNLRELRAGDWVAQLVNYALEHADPLRAREVDETSPQQVFAYVMKHPERLLFIDQDAANAVLWRRRLKLHPRWNYQLLFRRFDVRTAELTDEVVAEAARRPAIWHFEGPGQSKPWHAQPEFPEDAELYRRYRAGTPWPL